MSLQQWIEFARSLQVDVIHWLKGHHPELVP